jgi:hypothetical protein
VQSERDIEYTQLDECTIAGIYIGACTKTIAAVLQLVVMVLHAFIRSFVATNGFVHNMLHLLCSLVDLPICIVIFGDSDILLALLLPSSMVVSR